MNILEIINLCDFRGGLCQFSATESWTKMLLCSPRGRLLVNAYKQSENFVSTHLQTKNTFKQSPENKRKGEMGKKVFSAS